MIIGIHICFKPIKCASEMNFLDEVLFNENIEIAVNCAKLR